MKKLLFTLFTLLTTLQGWGVAQQTYTDPSQLPPAFEFDAVRYDYRGTDEFGEPIVAHIQEGITVKWNPNIQYGSTYGELVINNFYYNDCVVPAQVNITFNNRNSKNFQWIAEENCIVFSFAAYCWSSTPNSDYSYAAKYSSHKHAWLGLARNAPGGGSTYWISGQNSYYGWSAGVIECRLYLETNTIEINSMWGAFMMNSQFSSANSSTVLEVFDHSVFRGPDPTTLAWIVDKGDVTQEYVVADDLVGVKLVGVYGENSNDPVSYLLYAKDYKKFANPDVVKDGQKNYMVKTGVFPDEYDQSNWVALSFEAMETQPELIQFDNLIGHVIKGGTIKGTYTDDVNPTIAVTQLPTGGVAETYEPNVYIVPSFCDEYVEEGSQYFFVQPKPQEYCTVQWANYDATTNAFYVPASENGNNGWDLSGGFEWQTSYLPSQDRTPVNQGMYTFPAIVKRKSTPPAPTPRRITTATPKVGSVSSRYEVYPLQIESSSIITGITTVRSDAVDDGYYYTITGQRVTNPTPGFYIRGGKKVIVR